MTVIDAEKVERQIGKGLRWLALQGITDNMACLILHRPAMLRRPNAQPRFHTVFQIAKEQTRHNLTANDIIYNI